MAYSKVHISNSTNYAVRGHVSYAACSGDDFEIQPMQSWTAKSRGVCLLTRISATVYTPDHTVDAESYRSSGTSYSQFSILQLDPGKYTVSRVVT